MKYKNRYVLGDIHGEMQQLIKVLNNCNFDEDDLLISLGDLSDRGLNSWGVAECLMKIKNFIFIRGNHDFHMRNWLFDGQFSLNWFQNGGDMTILSYEKNDMRNREKHLAFYDSALPYFVLDNKLFEGHFSFK